MMNDKQQIQSDVLLKILLFIASITISACMPFQPIELTPMITSLPSEIPTSRPVTITPTFDPNEVLVSYTQYSDGGDEIKKCVSVTGWPQFLLYANGQLIIYRDAQYWESILSQSEISLLLKKIENTGILNLGKVKEDGWEELIVKGRRYYSSAETAIGETLEIIEHFDPESRKSYVPERLHWRVFPVDNPDFLKDGLPEPVPPTRKWIKGSGAKALSEYGLFQELKGQEMLSIMAQFDHFPAYQVFEENELLYITAICPFSE